MTEYKPDWDSIPEEFKYCYYYQDPMTDPEAQAVLCKNRVPYFDGRNMHRIERPPELVDGAWYAFTDRKGYSFAGRYGFENYIWVGGSPYLARDVTIHNRIPDELWNNN